MGEGERENNPSYVKNKSKRTALYKKFKQQKKKEKKERQEERKRVAKELGDDAPAPKVQRTIDNAREGDATIVNPEDEEIINDQASDELSNFFTEGAEPKILITTCHKPIGNTYTFAEEVLNLIPGAEFYERKNFDLKEISEYAINRGFTDIMVFNEDRKICNGLTLTHLPEGPTATFKLSSITLHNQLKRRAKITSHHPELVLNGFTTRIGHQVGRMFGALFPHKPNFVGRRVVTFHNQRDYIFFRHHRYVFRNEKRVGLQEIGPRFTLKLMSVQKGTFDSKNGEYEWKRKDKMDASRRRFYL